MKIRSIKLAPLISTAMFLTLLGQTSGIMAQECETVEQYDRSLKSLSIRSESFADKYSPALKADLKPGNRALLHPAYTAYNDSSLDKKNGQSFNAFLSSNSRQFKKINNSNSQMNGLKPSSDKVLSLQHAQEMLGSSDTTCKSYIDNKNGKCFLNSTHTANEVAQKFPNVPVMKVWLFGTLRGKTEKHNWTYHVAPAVPVKVSGKIEWMVLDTLLSDKGPLSVKDWTQEIHHQNTFSSKVSMYFSAADRIGSGYNTTLKELSYERGGSANANSLIKAGKNQR